MIPKKPAPDLIRGGNRFSGRIMLKRSNACRNPCGVPLHDFVEKQLRTMAAGLWKTCRQMLDIVWTMLRTRPLFCCCELRGRTWHGKAIQ
jgi:hypothetical protein